jgi:hypothetical protein
MQFAKYAAPFRLSPCALFSISYEPFGFSGLPIHDSQCALETQHSGALSEAGC